jgi:hypothetical protein
MHLKMSLDGRLKAFIPITVEEACMNDETVINTYHNRFFLEFAFREMRSGIKRRILNLSKSTAGNDAFEFFFQLSLCGP